MESGASRVRVGGEPTAGEGRQGSGGPTLGEPKSATSSGSCFCHLHSGNVLFSLRNDGTEFGGSIYQKVNDQLETAVNLAWTAGNSNTRFGIAAKYQIDPDASFSVSVTCGSN